MNKKKTEKKSQSEELKNTETINIENQETNIISDETTQNEQKNDNNNKELMEEIKSLKEQVDILTKERDNYKDALLRKAAELENFRRIKEKEFADSVSTLHTMVLQAIQDL